MEFAFLCFFVFLVAIYCLPRSWAELVNQPQTEAEAGGEPACCGLVSRPAHRLTEGLLSMNPNVPRGPRSIGDLRSERRCGRETAPQPYGDEDWMKATVKQLGLESTLGSRGRPAKTAP